MFVESLSIHLQKCPFDTSKQMISKCVFEINVTLQSGLILISRSGADNISQLSFTTTLILLQIFFFKAKLMQGDFMQRPDVGISDYKWVTREELDSHLIKGYSDTIKSFILPVSL